MIKSSKAYEYACWCVEEGNEFVGDYIKKQAQSWIDIVEGKNEEAYVNEKVYKKICKILKIITHPDLMAPMHECMEDYAWFLIIAVFCTLSRVDDRRYYETALLEISRKNFKTFYSAVIFIIGMLTEPNFSRFFSVAPDFKLSNELRLAVRKIVKASPALDKYFKINRDMILCKLTDIEYVPLAYSNDRMDGKLANIFLADEAGAMDDYPVEAMRSSQITLRNKLGIIISTQYPNDSNVMIDEIDISKKVLDGLSNNKKRFSLLYEPNDELIKEWESNDLVIYQSNPVTVKNKDIFNALIEKREMAVIYENKRENYLCKHNNIKYQGLGVEGYIEIDRVRLCKQEEDLDFWREKNVWLGLDLSQTDDNTAIAMACEHEGIVYGKVFGFVPEDRVALKSNKEKVDYNKLIREGVCFKCGDEVIDYSFVEKFILSLEEKYGVKIMQVGYDRYNAISTVQKLEENSIECVEIKQHSSVLHSPTKWLKELVLSKNFRYDKNLMLEINFQNARCTEDTNKNKYVNKKKSAGKVDMVVSLINALYLVQQENLYGNGGFGVQVI